MPATRRRRAELGGERTDAEGRPGPAPLPPTLSSCRAPPIRGRYRRAGYPTDLRRPARRWGQGRLEGEGEAALFSSRNDGGAFTALPSRTKSFNGVAWDWLGARLPRSRRDADMDAGVGEINGALLSSATAVARHPAAASPSVHGWIRQRLQPGLVDMTATAIWTVWGMPAAPYSVRNDGARSRR